MIAMGIGVGQTESLRNHLKWFLFLRVVVITCFFGAFAVAQFAAGDLGDAAGLLKPFAGIADMVHTLPIEGHECRDPKDLADMARKQGFKAHPRETIGQALAAIRKPSRALVFGSLYLAGEALAANGNIPD